MSALQSKKQEYTAEYDSDDEDARAEMLLRAGKRMWCAMLQGARDAYQEQAEADALQFVIGEDVGLVIDMEAGDEDPNAVKEDPRYIHGKDERPPSPHDHPPVEIPDTEHARQTAVTLLFQAAEFDDYELYLSIANQHLKDKNDATAENRRKMVDVNAHGEKGRTPVHCAARACSIRVIQAMVAHEIVDCRLLDDKGQTPLHYAAYYGNAEVIEHLLKSRSSPAIDTEDNDGAHAIHLAAAKGRVKALHMLLSNKADVNAIDGKSGLTPLHRACGRGHIKAARVLLRAGARVNCQGYRGQTPMHLAVIQGASDMVELLFEHHASVDIKNLAGKTALDAAADAYAAVPQWVEGADSANLNAKRTVADSDSGEENEKHNKIVNGRMNIEAVHGTFSHLMEMHSVNGGNDPVILGAKSRA